VQDKEVTPDQREFQETRVSLGFKFFIKRKIQLIYYDACLHFKLVVN